MNFQSIIKVVILLLCVSLGAHSKLNASTRDTTCPLAIEIRNTRGFVIRHHLDMGVYTTHYFPNLEISLCKPTSGEKNWHQNYKYPVIGLAYWYSSLGNTTALGNAHAIFAYGLFSLKENSRSELNMRFGCGIGYLSKKFEPYTNYKNLAIGSHLNANLQLLIEYRYHVSHEFDLGASIGLAHFSNGTMITPNDGINVPNAGILLAWRKGDWNKHLISTVNEPFKRHWDLSLSMYGGSKEVMPAMGRKYLVLTGSADWIYARSPKGGIGVGLDLTWDSSDSTMLFRLKKETTTEAGLLKPGAKFIKQWCFGKLNLNFEVGMYLYIKEASDGSIYDKLSLQYFINKELFTSMALKTHYGKADFVVLGLGYRIK